MSALLRKYNAATTINFELFEIDGVDLRVDAVHAAGDTTIMKDEGPEASTGSGFVDEGQGYSIALTNTEMTAARIVIYVVDLTATKVWLDRTIIIETYGNPSAQHAFDLSVTKQPVDLVTWLGAVPNALLSGRVRSTPAIARGTADSGTTDTLVDLALTEAVANHWKGSWLVITGGTPAIIGQARKISLFTPASDQLTVDRAFTAAIDATTTYEIWPADFPNNFSLSAISADGSVNAQPEVATNIATLASQVSFTLDSGSPDDDAYNGWTCVITDVTDASQKAVALISDYTGLTKTVTLEIDPGIFTMAVGDFIQLEAQRVGAETITAGGVEKIADALLDRVAGIETGFTPREALRLILSASAGKLSGAATTNVKIRDVNDTKDRINATVDASGNRTAVIKDVT